MAYSTDDDLTEAYSMDSTVVLSQAESIPLDLPSLLPISVAGMMSQARLCIEAHLTDESQCVQWCIEKGLIANRRECRVHRAPRSLVRHEGVHGLRWWCSRCRKYDAALKGSIFEASHLKIGQAIMVIYCFAWDFTYEQVKLATQLTAGSAVLSNKTIADWFSDMRDCIIDYAAVQSRDRGRIGGPGMIVQIDEAKIGRRKYNRGRVGPGTWVLGMIDSAGALRLTICPDRSKETLQALIEEHVDPDSIVHTDQWRGYCGLEELGYCHETVNHQLNFVAPDNVHTQRIESQWRNLRRKFSKGGIDHKDINAHLMEHVWRRDNRLNNRDPFLELLKLCRINQA